MPGKIPERSDSILDPEALTREQLVIAKKGSETGGGDAAWTPNDFKKLAQVGGPPDNHPIDSPNVGRRVNYYHLHLHVQNPPLQSVLDSEDKNGSMHNF